MRIPTIQRRDDTPADNTQPGIETAQTIERLVPVYAPLAGQVIKGTLLSFITLGIYRFWYRTGLRRYYWGNTTLAGDGFEYTGTGKELFVGFLIALAIVLPLYLVVTLLGIYGGEMLGPIVASILGSLVMPALVQILIFRARRYRLARTRYRGVRFHQTGTGMGYLFHTVKWLLLSALTLGILFPYLRRSLERYKTENTWYGSAQGAFSAPVKPLMTSWLLVWFIVILGVCCLVAMGAAMGMVRRPSWSSFGLVTVLGVFTFASFLAVQFAWIRYRVVEFRTFVGGTSFGEIRLASDLSTGSVIWAWVRYGLILIGMVIVLSLVGGLMGLKLKPMMAEDPGAALVQGPLVLLLLIAFFLSWVLATEILFRRRLWALRAASVSVTNLAALDRIVQTAGQEAGGVGEAFDTGFDIAG